MEIIFLCSMISQLRNSEICQLHMHIGVIWPRCVNIGNRPVIGTTMKGCQVRDWIVGERDLSISKSVYMTCVDGD